MPFSDPAFKHTKDHFKIGDGVTKDRDDYNTFRNILRMQDFNKTRLDYIYSFIAWCKGEIPLSAAIGYEASHTTTASPENIPIGDRFESVGPDITKDTGPDSFDLSPDYPYLLMAWVKVTGLAASTDTATMRWWNGTAYQGDAIAILDNEVGLPVVRLVPKLSVRTDYNLRKVSHTGANEPTLEVQYLARQLSPHETPPTEPT